MKQSKKIWFDGRFVNWEKAKIHILTHTLHYGSGVFEGIRAYNTKKGVAVFRLDDHLKRFFYSASVFRMKLGLKRQELKEIILRLIKLNNLRDCYIRPIAFFGEKMGLNPKGVKTHLAVAAWPWGAYLGEKPVKTIISKFIRLHPKSIVSDAKVSGYYANSIFASLEAERKRAQEALLLDFQGYVAEGPGENVFLIKKGKAFTPSLGSILPGITRDTVFSILKELKVPWKEKKIKPEELKKADEAFFCGTAVEICPIGRIDNTLINKGKIGPITSEVRAFYHKIVRGEERKYLKWLSFVD